MQSRIEFVIASLLAVLGISGVARASPTIVTLAFDGAAVDLMAARPLLSARGLHATFFANSGLIGQPGRLSLSQLQDLQSDGNEIGGATAYGLDLLTLPAAEQAREICVDRSFLLASGLQASSFAYPKSLGDPTTSAAVDLVSQCGYGAARKTGGLGCPLCPSAVALPPADPLRLASLPPISTTTSLEDLEGHAGAAAADGGGWVLFVGEHVCDSNCPDLSVSPATLGAFLDWLGSQSPAIQVATLAQVSGAGSLPAVAGPLPTGPAPDGNLLQNGSLEQSSNGDGVPDCWEQDGEGTNSFVFTRISDAHSGQFAQQIEISDLSSGGRRLVSREDLGQCAPPAIAGHRYQLTAWVKTQGLASLAAYTRASSGVWSYWAKSPDLSLSSSYQQVKWTLPPVPAGAEGLSVGASLVGRGSLTVDDLRLEDLGPGGSGGCATGWGGSGTIAWLAGLLLSFWRRR